ncbi:uroporphyrinogen decarboxylase [Sulfobacillus thermosulfidooxidans]|nr:uroporphyrinogen decarboxylase [Sulfobacillus thermosulfidooxidans]OLZ14996.1 uroporphyrinogen decarboxylase [Sulfobacillus thermosulfidooxidans]OLZ19645.1 uroporphyrinogen decarboxylase [Sulfobacillus thermosulfidooxidans]
MPEGGTTGVSHASRFIDACWGKPHDAIPVWFMRQAGRYQAGYRQLREQYSFLEMAHSEDVITEVTCRPVEELGVDAAILFSDIMIPLGPMGIDFDIQEHKGPVIAQPIRSAKDLSRLHPLRPEEDLPEVFSSIERICARIDPIPLIGFAGAPFTLASYIIEGGPSKQYENTKKMMWEQPALWQDLMMRLAEGIVEHLSAQIRHGVQAVQIFDSWIGTLSVNDYATFVLPVMQYIFAQLEKFQVPTIYFGTGTAALLPLMKQAGASVLGIDWRVPLSQVRRQLGNDITLQGNLDPVALLSSWDVIADQATHILTMMAHDPRYIFNLGHGVPPAANADDLKRLVQLVHEYPYQTYEA